MDSKEFVSKIKEAADTNRKIEIVFERDVVIPIHRQYKSVRSVKIIIFSAHSPVNGENSFLREDGALPYAYKMRLIDRTGYLVKFLPVEQIKSIEYVEDTVVTEECRKKFLSYVVRSKDSDVWPNISDIIMSRSANRPAAELTAKLYLSSKVDRWDMQNIEEMFSKRKEGKYYLGGLESERHVLMEKRQDGYYAWYVDGRNTWVLINPRVAILGRRSI